MHQQNKIKGFYLYAIRPASHATTFPEIKGIDGKSGVFTVFVGDKIWAIVSHVPLKEFGAEEIAHKAQNDLQWIKEKSLIHNRVIMESSKGADGAIVPMKFGLIFKDKEGLVKAVRKDSKKFLGLFEKLKGKEEWSAKVFVGNAELLDESIIANEPALQARKKEIDSLPAGLAYFKEKELRGEMEKRKKDDSSRQSREVYEIFRKFVDEVKFGKILGKEFTARTEPMILNIIFLINKKKINNFFKEAEKVRSMLERKGLIIEIAGPWPPYNFANFPCEHSEQLEN
jgi:hypothetical protein